MTPPPSEEPRALTVRLYPLVREDAQRYCKRVGISMNALVSIALVEFLDDQAQVDAAAKRYRAGAVAAPAGKRAAEAAKALPGPLPFGLKPPKRPRDHCPCASGLQYRHCHGQAHVE